MTVGYKTTSTAVAVQVVLNPILTLSLSLYLKRLT